MLPEVNDNTNDKQMFFATQPFDGVFPPRNEIANTLKIELPYFAWWLLNAYRPLPTIVSDDRMGVKSFFDPNLLITSQNQAYSSSLLEHIRNWQELDDGYWTDPKVTEWVGKAPAPLISIFSLHNQMIKASNEWTTASMARNLTSLARLPDSPVITVNDASRTFKIIRIPK